MSTKGIISIKVQEALLRHGLPLDSRVREELERNAVIGGGFHPEVVIRDQNIELTLDQRIGQLREDPNFRDCFPHPPRTISRNDHEAIRQNFDAIAKGTVLL